jgi:6-phosphogluconolactonase
VEHHLEVFDDHVAVAEAGAGYIAARARQATAGTNRTFTMAVSGGKEPWVMFAALAREDVPWHKVTLYQVDERVAPAGDPDRNLTHLEETLAAVEVDIRPMPVEDADLEMAALHYGDALPRRFDLVHLGIGPDGHCASLVPDDPVLEVVDRPVAVTAPYQDRRRMTLTYPALARADQLLWLITGEDKRSPLARLWAGDRSIPAGRVEAAASLIMADAAAAPAT